MNKTASSSATAPRLCPTCGTRVGAAATKCLVCGADLTLPEGASRPQPRLPSLGPAEPVRLPVPLIIVLVLVLAAGAAAAYYFTTRTRPQVPVVAANASSTPTITNTPLPTFTYTPTPTESPVPTDTPLPPISYKVVAGDTCVAIAAKFNVSSQSIILLNGLDPNCNLSVGRSLQIPQPTSTPTPLPTATLGGVVATQVPRTTYTVHPGDTLAGIAKFYGVSVADLMDVNG